MTRRIWIPADLISLDDVLGRGYGITAPVS